MTSRSTDASMKEGVLLCLGNMLLDIIATVPEAFLKKYNLEADTIQLAEDKHLILFDEIKNGIYDFEYAPGGSALNTTRVSQWLLRYPKATTFVGAVGDDEESTKLLALLDKEGIKSVCQKIAGESTGRCAVLISGNKRTLVTQLGAANHFDSTAFKNQDNFGVLQIAKVVYISGYFLKTSFSSAMEVATLSNSRNCSVVLNLNAEWVVNMFHKELKEIFPLINILIGNYSEVKAFIKQCGLSYENPYDIAKCLSQFQIPRDRNQTPRIVIITRGDENVIVAKGVEIEEYPVLKVSNDKMVDTNGAGDAFAGGLLTGLVQNASIDLCIKCGLWASAEIIQQTGCSFPKEKYFQFTP